MITHPNCKINLGLHVVGKRADGYHDLETIFVPVYDLCDELEIVEGPLEMRQDGIVLDNAPEDNLCMKAWRLLHSEFGIPTVSIRLKKNIPFGAGLGGGSSDAAFTLKMLNEMFELGLDTPGLERRAARLGADCAFFVRNRPAYATGIGDILEPIGLDLSSYRIAIEIPEGEHVSTKEAYAGLTYAPALTGTPSNLEGELDSNGRGSGNGVLSFRRNDRDILDEGTFSSSPSKIEGVAAGGGRGRMTAHPHNKSYLEPIRRNLRSFGTAAEASLWNRLKQKKLFNLQFRRQFSIENYILDFYCPTLKLAIELDGEVHNEQVEQDKQRDKYLRDNHGITVLRYENKVVFERPNYIVEDIQHYMQCKIGKPAVSTYAPALTGTPSNLEGELLARSVQFNSPSKIEGVAAEGGRGRMNRRPDLREAVRQPIGEWRDLIVNDFEASVFPAHSAIAALKEEMYRRGALYASMTGSGAAVFGIFRK